jgi:ABC-type polysaccharide/polyol phosphate transport system ATPase subunit
MRSSEHRDSDGASPLAVVLGDGEGPAIMVDRVRREYVEARVSRIRLAFARLGGLDVQTRSSIGADDDDEEADDDLDDFDEVSPADVGPTVVALDDVSLHVSGAGCLGVVGPPGCGKSVLLRAIAGLTPLDRGRIAVEGTVAPLLPSVVALMPRQEKLKRTLPVLASLLRLSPRLVRERLPEIMGLLGDSSLADVSVSALGKRRNEPLFAMMLSIGPDIVLLDLRLPSGTLGAACRARLGELKESGALILVTGRQPKEVSWLADRVVTMSHGRIVGEASPDVSVEDVAGVRSR